MGRLPARIDPIRLADDGIRLHGSLPFARLPRLTAMCETPGREADVELVFERGPDGMRYMRGTLRATVSAECRRCLGRLDLVLVAVPRVAWVAPGVPVDDVAEPYEVLVADGAVDLGALVEDELLLVWPMFPAHENVACIAPEGTPDRSHAGGPFASLGKFKGKGH
ncbi:MAG: YceD family protein [Acidiferrobacteraceae bacterium]